MNKILILITLSVASVQTYYAQMENAINLGMVLPERTLQGSARYVGTGGVISTVGGDISNLTTNPAGLGMFSRSEFQISPTLQVNNLNNNYQYVVSGTTVGSSVLDNDRVRFTLNNLGVVIANRRSEKSTLRSSNVTIAINRIANYNRTIDFGSDNRAYSYSNYLSDRANYYASKSSKFPEQYYSLDIDYSRVLMSMEAQQTLYDAASSQYTDPIPYSSGQVVQNGYKKITGGITELSAAWAGSIKDRLYIGVSLGIPIVSYRTELLFQEDNVGATYISPTGYGRFIYSDLSENDLMTGAGINLKFGGLYKINDNIRASAYIHTPTYYRMTNEYALGMTTQYEFSTNPVSREIGEMSFNYFSPFRMGGGLSFLAGKNGFIGAEYEFCNNLGTRIDVESVTSNKDVNDALKNEQVNTHTFRIGGEYAYEMFRLRAGYNYTTGSVNSAYQFRGIDKATQTFSGGIGIRGKQTSFDLTYMRSQREESYKVYDHYDYNNGVEIEGFYMTNWITQNQFVATLNYRF